VAAGALGHANISTTADIYGHITPEMQERAAERMDRVLAGG
jgi:integrase